nr:malate synthase-like [Onthophagus taurus]
MEIEISKCPQDLQHNFEVIFNRGSLVFLKELENEFRDKINKLYKDRLNRNSYYQSNNTLPNFKNNPLKTPWKISNIPQRLQNRKIDLGDVSPSNSTQFFTSLTQNVQGIQVDFDDGHCPNWRNQILGHYNIYSVIHSNNLAHYPVMMLRPRAWNILEHNVKINQKKIPGALIDFALLMYHNAKILLETNSGPYFYLSKLESASEARLWNEIFVWTQRKLNLPQGSIKCCVLIENILASFEMEEILFELKEHCVGLNCGMWDYIASIIAKFGNRKEFVLADRQKLSMKNEFLKTYMDLLVEVCHKRGALATGGMIAKILSYDLNSLESIKEMKQFEISSGIDGFLVYDLDLLPHINKLWEDNKNLLHPKKIIKKDSNTAKSLLTLPEGKVTWDSFWHNIQVTVLFIYNWLDGNGHFVLNGFVEDSATAEISRSQIWQWIKHKVEIDETVISQQLLKEKLTEYKRKNSNLDQKNLKIALKVAMELFISPIYPDFITTYLNNHPKLQMEYKPITTKL